jgi:hypothetical protein
MPSLSNSPSMRGVPNRDFAAHVTDKVTNLAWDRPTATFPMSDLPRREQAKRIACEAMRVSGLTIVNDERQSAHTRDSQTHRSRSAACSRGRFVRRALKNADLVPKRNILKM